MPSKNKADPIWGIDQETVLKNDLVNKIITTSEPLAQDDISTTESDLEISTIESQKNDDHGNSLSHKFKSNSCILITFVLFRKFRYDF